MRIFWSEVIEAARAAHCHFLELYIALSTHRPKQPRYVEEVIIETSKIRDPTWHTVSLTQVFVLGQPSVMVHHPSSKAYLLENLSQSVNLSSRMMLKRLSGQSILHPGMGHDHKPQKNLDPKLHSGEKLKVWNLKRALQAAKLLCWVRWKIGGRPCIQGVPPVNS